MAYARPIFRSPCRDYTVRPAHPGCDRIWEEVRRRSARSFSIPAAPLRDRDAAMDGYACAEASKRATAGGSARTPPTRR